MPPIRPNVLAMAGYIPGEQPADTATIKLNTNENPYPPSPRVMDAIGAVTPEALRRYPHPNARPFREAAARIHNLPPDYLQTYNGGDELLSVAIRAAAGESATVAYLDPSYSLYPVLADMQAARKLVLPYTYQAPRRQSKIEKRGGENRKSPLVPPPNLAATPASILLIVNPNAPTGHLNPLDRLGEIAAAFPGLLLLDEAYINFADNPEGGIPLVRHYPNVLILRTLSKGYSLAGLRFGYAIAQPALLAQLEKVRDSYPNDALSIAAATAAIEDQPYAQSTWQKVRSERTRLSSALRALGFALPDSQSNFVLAQVPATARAQAVYESLKSRGLLVRWWDLPRIADKLRITVGTPEQNNRLLAELRSILQSKSEN